MKSTGDILGAVVEDLRRHAEAVLPDRLEPAEFDLPDTGDTATAVTITAPPPIPDLPQEEVLPEEAEPQEEAIPDDVEEEAEGLPVEMPPDLAEPGKEEASDEQEEEPEPDLEGAPEDDLEPQHEPEPDEAS